LHEFQLALCREPRAPIGKRELIKESRPNISTDLGINGIDYRLEDGDVPYILGFGVYTDAHSK